MPDSKKVRLICNIMLFFLLWIFVTHASFADNERWTIEDSMKVRKIGSFSISPDGRKVIYTSLELVATEKENRVKERVFLASTDGKSNFRFLHDDDKLEGFQWSPDGKMIAYIKRQEAASEIWMIPSDGGGPFKVTNLKSDIHSVQWSPEGNSIAFTMTDPQTEKEKKDSEDKNDAQVLDENVKMNHIWLVTVKRNSKDEFETSQLTKGDFSVTNFDWSPDGKSIVFDHGKTPSMRDFLCSKISVVDLRSGRIVSIADTGGWETNPIYSHDGRWIAFLRGNLGESYYFIQDAYIVPSTGGSPRALARSFDRYALSFTGWSKDDKFIYYNGLRGPCNEIYALPIDGKPPVKISRLEKPKMTFTSPAMNSPGSKFGFVLTGTAEPEELYITGTDAFKPVKISNINKGFPLNGIAGTELINWNSSDGRRIEGLLTYPRNYVKGKKYPLLLIIHGGPTGVFSYDFIGGAGVYPIAAFASEGFAVLRCNIRGSSGYGTEFRKANSRDWGGMDYRDLMAGVDHVMNMGIADPDRLGVMGWSYGGYMTSWIITQTDRFKAASVGAGVINLISFTGTTDLPDFIPQYFECPFWENYELYISHSSIGHVRNVRTPTLILHGARDTRVPFDQGKELYTALKMRGVPVKMVSYPRSGHGIREPRLVIDGAKRNLDWFTHYLKDNQ